MNNSLIEGQFETDKSQAYLNRYLEMFSPLKEKQVLLLELGIFKGGSLKLWREYFANGLIVGIDSNSAVVEQIAKDLDERTRVFCGRQEDEAFLDTVSRECAPEGFDIIIDDASHIASLTRKSFWYLFDNYLKNGGLYIIEDWGTGYWKSWPDGEQYYHTNHLAGLVGFIKELIDEIGRVDIGKDLDSVRAYSKFDSIQIFHGQVFVKKAGC